MNRDELTTVFTHSLKDETGAFLRVDRLLADAIDEWFARHGSKLHPDNHFLQLGPVRMFWSKERTRYERTADLILKGTVTSSEWADKVLVKDALRFTAQWLNEQDDDGGVGKAGKAKET